MSKRKELKCAKRKSSKYQLVTSISMSSSQLYHSDNQKKNHVLL